MGWLFNWSKGFDKKCLVDSFSDSGFFTKGCTLLDSRVVGNNFWGVIEHEGHKMIWLALMQPGGENEGWGYKSMDESSGPDRLDCPLLLIRQCSEPRHEYAAQWREDVKAWHKTQSALKKQMAVVAHGTSLSLNGIAYKAIRSAGPRKGWVVQDIAGKLFRMPVVQLNRCLKLLIESKAPQELRVQSSMAF